MKKKTLLKVSILIFFSLIFMLAYHFNIFSLISLENLKLHRNNLLTIYAEMPLIFLLSYSLLYVLVVATSLPFGGILTLTGGALFGNPIATIIVIISATIGATIAFLLGRFLFRENLENKYKDQIQRFNDGLQKNEVRYMLSLRVLAVIPFFILNITSGLTRISLKAYIIGTFFGMLPATFIFTHAGSQLFRINSLSEILSPEILGVFVLIAAVIAFPALLKSRKKTKKS